MRRYHLKNITLDKRKNIYARGYYTNKHGYKQGRLCSLIIRVIQRYAPFVLGQRDPAGSCVWKMIGL